MFVAGAERGRGLVFVGGGALVVVGGTGYANNRGWQPMADGRGMLGGRLAGALVPLGVEMQTKQQEKKRRSEKHVEKVSSRTRNV